MKRKLLLAALLCATSSARALDTTYDARSLGMGGAGAASANSLNAAYQNPAALANLPDEDFVLALPVVSLRLLDADGLIDNLQTLDSRAQTMSSALTQFGNDFSGLSSTNPTTQINSINSITGLTGSAKRVVNALNGFNSALVSISNKSLAGAGFGGALLGIPSSKFSFALAADVRAEMNGFFNYTTADQTQINSIITNLDSCSTVTLANLTSIINNCTNVNNQIGGNGQFTTLTSSFNVRGVVLQEAGITMARHFADWGDIDLGITPKFINFTSYDFSVDAQSQNSNITLDSGAKKETMFTFDLGAAQSIKTDGGNVLKTGLVAKNLLSKKTTTILGNEVEIAPQLTAGVAYSGSWFTTTGDLDMLKSKSMLKGLNKDAQYLRLGAEIDAWSWAQFRMGYRHDLAGNYDGLPSVGLGLFHVLDLSVAKVGKKEAAVAAQLGIRF